ncbi:MAG: transcriptional repressor [Thermodesulfobacteriota bacterium]
MHRQERQQFKEVLESFGATRVKERLLILDIFLGIEEHFTLSGLEAIVRERLPELLDREFLSETMEMFCRYGFAQKRVFEAQEPVFEHRHLGVHHDHFICTRCGKIEEFISEEIERLQQQIAESRNFHPLQHKLEIYGLCAACMAQREPALPLPLAANGERVRIVRIAGGREAAARLADLGLVPGECLEVISNHPSGPFIVALRGARLAINSGMAQKIMVAHSCPHAGEE